MRGLPGTKVRLSDDVPAVGNDLEVAIKSTRRKLLPFLLLMYVAAFLDRANISFAKPSLEATRGISESAFALGAGLFFLSYAAFEVPSNLILHRIGAKIWMCRIMVTWGLISMATMFVRGPASFYALRLGLGFAEAGFFPGIILYLTYWFPDRVRSQVFGQFYFGAPLAFIFGGPLSVGLLKMGGIFGLLGWQWMFLVEGLFAVAIGIWAFWYLADRPSDATWLSDAERAALQHAMTDEDDLRRLHGPSDFRAAMTHHRLWHLVAIYILIQMSVYGVVFYLPSEVSAILGNSMGLEAGGVSALPWICALATAYWLPKLADRMHQRSRTAAIVLLISGIASAFFLVPMRAAGLGAICIAASGFIAVQPVFWTLSADYLAGRAAAGGFAVVNSFGALGGFLAPNVKVWADRHYGNSSAGLYVLAAMALAASALIATAKQTRPSDL